MKISRYKKAQRVLNFYKNNYGFHEPYQILIDATFCYAALQNKINIKEQLSKYLQCELKFLTTQCIILESESLGPKVHGATQIVKQFAIHKCGHEKNLKCGSDCIKTMVKDNHYIIATQDRDLQSLLRLKSGQPILYLHNCTPVLEQPSNKSKTNADDKINETLTFTELNENKLKLLKQQIGINTETIKIKKKIKKKLPNPLSCKKKKKKPEQLHTQNQLKNLNTNDNVKNPTIEKKRNRKKIPKHIKEHIIQMLK